MDISTDFLKTVQRQTAIIAQVLAVTVSQSGGSYDLVEVESMMDWTGQTFKAIVIRLSEGPTLTVPLVDMIMLPGGFRSVEREPEHSSLAELTYWLEQKVSGGS